MSEVIIKTTTTIKGLFIPPLPPGEYEAGYNKHGAVYVMLPGGQTLGVKPGEFEFIKAPPDLLEKWKEFLNTETEKKAQLDVLKVKIVTVAGKELGKKLINIFETEEHHTIERESAFLESTIDEMQKGADYSRCENIDDVSAVFAQNLVDRLYPD